MTIITSIVAIIASIALNKIEFFVNVQFLIQYSTHSYAFYMLCIMTGCKRPCQNLDQNVFISFDS